MTRAAIYARYSSNLQDATSIGDQVAMARRLCAREGRTVVAVFEDREKTGRNARRPGLQAMKEAISRREIDDGEADIVRRIFRETADGRSALSIARGLNADHISAP